MARMHASVDWASLLSALLIDIILLWGPALIAFFHAPSQPLPWAPACLGAALVMNLVLYSRGSTFGTYLCGFRLRTRDGGRPGLKFGLLLLLLNLLAVAFVAVIVLLGDNSSGPDTPLTADVHKYPIRAERTRPRRLLQAADAYWRRWSG